MHQRTTTRRWPRAAAAGVLAVLAACAPRIEPAGPAVVAPALEAGHLLAADGARLPLRQWRAQGPERAVIVAIHGFNDYSKAFDGPAAFWAARGLTTYAFDQRGFGESPNHGLWPGIDTMVDDLAMAARLIGAAHPDTPLYLVGESMGGAAAMVLMARADPPAIAGMVLVAPAVWGWQAMNPFYKTALWLGAHSIPWAALSGRGLGIKPSDNRDMLVALAQDPHVIKRTRIDSIYGLVNLMDAAFDAAPHIAAPTLVQYGEHDDLVPKGPTYDMLRRLKAPHRVALYDTGYHMLLRDLDAEPVLADIAAWITDPAAPLPSGREREAGQIFAAE